MEETIKKKKSIVLFAIIGVALVLVAVIVLIVVKTNSPEYKFKKQLEIADKYLAELNYEQAIVAYQMALEIDPMSVEAYLGLAEAYTGKGDNDSALEKLLQGYDRTRDEQLRKQAAELYLEKAESYISMQLYEQALAVLEEGYNNTNDEAIKKRIGEVEEVIRELEEKRRAEEEEAERLRKQKEEEDSRYITVTGAAFYISDIIPQEIKDEYDSLSWLSYGIRFKHPVTFIMDGQEITITESGLNTCKDELIGVMCEYTGQLVREKEKTGLNENGFYNYYPYDYQFEIFMDTYPPKIIDE